MTIVKFFVVWLVATLYIVSLRAWFDYILTGSSYKFKSRSTVIISLSSLAGIIVSVVLNDWV